MQGSLTQQPPDGAHPVAVVLRTKTRDPEVLEVIERLAGQSRIAAELIVIDSGSAPEIIEAFRRRVEQPAPFGRVELIRIAPHEYQNALALNRAIASATAPLIAIISQDALPADGEYLAQLAGPLERDPGLAGTYGRQVLKDRFCPFGHKDLTKTYPAQSQDQSAPNAWFVNTCSMVRRALWEAHPFDHHAGISEDHEWAAWAQSRGYRVRYVAEAVVRHYHYYEGLGTLWRRHRDEGAGLRRAGFPRQRLVQALYRLVRECASDALWFLPRGWLLAMVQSPLRRGTKHLALWWGARFGDGATPPAEPQRASSSTAR